MPTNNPVPGPFDIVAMGSAQLLATALTTAVGGTAEVQKRTDGGFVVVPDAVMAALLRKRASMFLRPGQGPVTLDVGPVIRPYVWGALAGGLILAVAVGVLAYRAGRP